MGLFTDDPSDDIMTFQEAIKAVRKEMNIDKGLYDAYHSNIACVLFDNGVPDMVKCNNLAEKIMEHIFGQ